MISIKVSGFIEMENFPFPRNSALICFAEKCEIFAEQKMQTIREKKNAQILHEKKFPPLSKEEKLLLII